jgi:VanZ family protein
MSSENQEATATSAFGPPVAWALLIFLASSIPAQAFPESRVFDYDKLIHMGIYGVFAFLLFRGFRLRRVPASLAIAGWLTLGICTAYGASDEFHQLFVPGRSCDVFDLLADLLGAGLAIAIALAWERRQAGRTGT